MALIVKKNDFIKFYKETIAEATKVVFKVAVESSSMVRATYFGGETSRTNLHVRTGALRRSIRPKPVQVTGTKVISGILAGTVYSVVHIGKAGRKTTIRPRRGKYLAIPLKAALTPSGVARGTPRGGTWGKTSVAKSKAGNLIIWGRKIMRSKNEHENRLGNKIIPLFILKKSVTIPTRIHPKDIMAWATPRLTKEMSIGISR
jgi:hypothetical protein